jgi:hypothetical protein
MIIVPNKQTLRRAMDVSDTTSLDAWISTVPELSETATSSRIQALCSDIALRKEANPAAYNANISWWRNTLSSLLARGAQPSRDHLVLHLNDALVQGIANSLGRRPLALTTVVVRQHRPLCTFMARITTVCPDRDASREGFNSTTPLHDFHATTH